MNPDELYSRVVDRDSFLEFAEALRHDREAEVKAEESSPSSPYSSGANGWENGSIEAFLEAGVAWARDSGWGSEPEADAANPWKLFAGFLNAGKFYE